MQIGTYETPGTVCQFWYLARDGKGSGRKQHDLPFARTRFNKDILLQMFIQRPHAVQLYDAQALEKAVARSHQSCSLNGAFD